MGPPSDMGSAGTAGIRGRRGPSWGAHRRPRRGRPRALLCGSDWSCPLLPPGSESEAPAGLLRRYTCNCKYPTGTAVWLQMQVPSGPDAAALLDRLVAGALPGRRGLDAWRSLLQAHATLIRRLDTDLIRETGLGLAD